MAGFTILTQDEVFSIEAGGWLGDFVMEVAEKAFVTACGALGAAAGSYISGGNPWVAGGGAALGAVVGQKVWDYIF